MERHGEAQHRAIGSGVERAGHGGGGRSPAALVETSAVHRVDQAADPRQDRRQGDPEHPPVEDEEKEGVQRQVDQVRPDSGPHGRASVLVRLDQRVGDDRPESREGRPTDEHRPVDLEAARDVGFEAEERRGDPQRKADHGEQRCQCPDQAPADAEVLLDLGVLVRPHGPRESGGDSGRQSDPAGNHQELEWDRQADRGHGLVTE